MVGCVPGLYVSSWINLSDTQASSAVRILSSDPSSYTDLCWGPRRIPSLGVFQLCQLSTQGERDEVSSVLRPYQEPDEEELGGFTYTSPCP